MSPGSPKTSFSDLLRAAEAGAPTASWKEPLLRRAALVSKVDRPLFDKVLSRELPGDGDVTFDQWSALPEVAPVPGSDGGFYVRDEPRARLLNTWDRDPAGLRAFSRKLLQHYRDAPALERVALQIFADPEKGLALCRATYEAADRLADLSTCDALLRILRNRSSLLSTHAPNVFEYLQRQEQYLRSRVLFVDDFARSSHYLARPALTAKVEDFLRQSGKWLLQIHAKGGLGKTVFLRWLIATRLVVERPGRKKRLPVARIDVDHVNRTTVAAAPTLLLVHAANQLDRQLPHEVGTGVFTTFLHTYARLMAAITPPVVRDEKTAGTTQSVELSAARATEIERNFCDALGERRGALLVLDTIEEMVLHNPDAWLVTLDLLERVCRRCRGLKVIVSGRYDFRERSEFNDWTRSRVAKGRMSTLALPDLTADEAFEYLTRIRKLTPAFPDRQVALLKGANPFKLAALGDRLGAGGTFTREDLVELREENVDYLIHRIIERLVGDCELQWLLRYIVVPNDLTREFLADVLIPHVKREAEGLHRDRPHDDLPPGAEAVKTTASWGPCAGPFNVDRLWDALRNYAGASSWITMDGGRPKLQPELFVPMRYLLRSQAVHEDVHADAARYFERKALAAPPDAASYTVEAIYHWFQSKGAAAAADWRRLIAGPDRTPTFVEMVTGSLLTGNYLDDHDEPLPHVGDRPIIDRETVIDVHFHLARARAALALYTADRSALTKRIDGNLRAMAKIETRLGKVVIPPERYAVCRAVVLWQSKGAVEALALIGRTLARVDGGLTDGDRMLLLVAQGTMLAKHSPDAAADSYEKASMLVAAGDAPLTYEAIRNRMGRLYFANAQLERAAAAFADAAASLARRQGPVTLYLQYVANLIEVLHQSARWSAIPPCLEDVRKNGRDEAQAATFVAVQRRRLDFATLRFRDVDASPPADGGHAEWRAARMAAMLHDEAVDAYRLAIKLFEQAGDLVTAQSCAIDQLDYVVNVLGHLNQAKSFASRLEPTGANWFRGQLALIELARHQSPDRARQMWSRAWADAVGPDRPDITVGARDRAAGLAFALAGGLVPRRTFEELVELLTQVDPLESRVLLLSAFEFLDPQEDRGAEGTAAAFVNVLPTLTADDPDLILRALPLADALVFAGETRRARTLLAQVIARGVSPDEPLLMRRLMGSVRRAGIPPDEPMIEAYLAGVRRRCASYPNFVLATHVEQAEWWLDCALVPQAKRTMNAVSLTPGEPNQYRCRYLAMQCRLAEEADVARSFRRMARAMISQLGQRADFVKLESVDLRSVARPGEPAAAVPAQPELVEVRAHCVTMQRIDVDRIDLRVRRYRAAKESHEVKLAAGPLMDVLASRASTSALDALLGNPENATHLLRQIVDPRMFDAGSGPDAVGLLLSIDDDFLAALPWQWILDRTPFPFVGIVCGAEPPIDTVRWLQATLSRLGTPAIVDGVAGPKTRRMLEEYDRRHQILEDGVLTPAAKRRLRLQAPEPVLILSDGYEMERSLRAGYGGFGVDIEKEWRSGFAGPLTVMRELSPSLLASASPSLIHIAMPVAQTESEILLVSGSRGQVEDGRALTPASLTKQLRALGPEACPFIVLDVPHHGSRGDTLKQLVLRNQFAAQLASIARVGVLATGIAGPRTPAFLKQLIEHVSSGESPADFVRHIGPLSLDAPPAIFSSDPTIPL